jgi:PPM family protein phosphatase
MLRVAADHFADSDTGRQRRANEDAFFARAPVFAVADGMGGAQAGEIASRTTIDVLAAGIPETGDPMEARLAAVVAEANDRVHGLSVSDERRAGMGTTLTVAHVGSDEVTIAHVGDSRLYRLRDGTLEKLTQDHSLVDEYRRQGRLTEEEAENHPQRSIITRAIGPEPRVEVDTLTVPGREGDVYLVCSDGLTTMLPEREVAGVLRGASSLRAAGRELIARANDAGGRDNITVVLFRLEEVGAGPEPETEEHQATTVSDALPRVEPSREGGAVALAEPRVAPRAPRAPAAPPPEARRRRLPVKGLLVGLVLWLGILLAGWFATQTVFFVGATDDGFVALYRGVPYDLPAGLDMYSEVYVSGVPAREADRTLVTGHELRSRDDAYAVVRALERGEAVRP